MSYIMLTRGPISKMCLRPQERELQRSKPFGNKDPRTSPSLWLSFEKLQRTQPCLTSKAGTWQTHVVETDVVPHPVGEGEPQTKINMREMGKGRHVTFPNTPLQRVCGGGNENRSFQKQKSKVKAPQAPNPHNPPMQRGVTRSTGTANPRNAREAS